MYKLCGRGFSEVWRLLAAFEARETGAGVNLDPRTGREARKSSTRLNYLRPLFLEDGREGARQIVKEQTATRLKLSLALYFLALYFLFFSTINTINIKQHKY